MNHVLKHLPKYVTVVCILIMLAFVASVNTGCTVTPENTTPPQAATLQSLKDKIADAQARGDELAEKAAEAELDAFEDQVMRERAGPIVGALSSVHPIVGALSPLLLGLAPLLGPRGRKAAGKTVKKMTVGDFAGAGMAALAYAGIAHSSPESKAAAEKADSAAKGTPVPLPGSPAGA